MVVNWGLNRWAVWLTITITVLDVIDARGLATLAGLIADVELPARLAHPRFLQQLQQLQPFQWLQMLRGFNPFAEVLRPRAAPGISMFHFRSSKMIDYKMIDYIEPLTIALIPALIVIDWAIRGRRHDSTPYWRLRATAVTIATFYLAGYVAVLWGTLLGDFHLLDGSPLGMWAGAALGVLVYELGHYWYHRAAHAWNWLWRAGHQMHHSAESLDAFGAYFLHPVDTIMFTTIGSLVFFPLLGLSLEAGLLGALFLTFNAMFQHMSFRTPRWLGYIIQRPESHSVHHGKNIHRYNYSDLPLWDLVFGTFRNPESFQKEHGFYAGGSDRIAEMLVFRDVTSPKRNEPGTTAKRTANGKIAA